MKEKEIIEFLVRNVSDLTLMEEQKHDVHRIERMITDTKVTIDRIQREGVKK